MKAMWKKRLAIVLTMSLVLGLITIAAPDEKDKVARAAGPDWNAATALTPNANGDVSIDVSGDYKLTANCKHIDVYDRESLTVNLNLNGFNVINDRSFTEQSDISAIHVKNGGGTNNNPGKTILNLYDTGNKSVITGKGFNGNIGLVGGGIYVDEYSVVTMYGGTVTNCVLEDMSRCNGAGVYVDSNASEFHLKGGKITNNKIQNATEQARGIGIYAEDGSKLTITGGEISGNNPGAATAGTVAKTVLGAGVYNAADNFTMSGGKISANGTTGDLLGGGLYLANDMAFSGGEITGNGQSGIYSQFGSIALTGTADLHDQANDATPDIEGIADGSPAFYHVPPAPAGKTGKKFVVREGSKTGTDVTANYKGSPAKDIKSKKLWILWEADATQTPAATTGSAASIKPSGSPTASTAPSGSPAPGPSTVPAPTNTPSGSPSASPSPSGSPSPGVSPSPAVTERPGPSDDPTSPYKPGEGKDTDEYKKLTDDEKKTAEDLVTVYPNMDYYTAAQVIEYAKTHDIDPDTLMITNETIEKLDDESDPVGAKFGKLRLRITKRWKKAMLIRWERLPKSEADDYVLYGNYCNQPNKGKFYKPEYLSEFDHSAYTYKHIGLKKGTYYKYIMRAFKQFNGIYVTVATTVCVHGTTKGNKKNTVAKAVKIYQKAKVGKTELKKKKITLSKGRTIKLTFKEIPEEKGKTIRPHRPVLFESADTSIVKIGKRNGKLKAVGKGKVIIYAYAQNGIYDQLTVTVK